MEDFQWRQFIQSFDERRDIIIPGDAQQTISFCAQQFIEIGQQAIASHGFFAVALSGGQTPHAIFKELSQPAYRQKLDWKKVLCFWSDERSVPPDHPESNYLTAMQAGLATLPIPKEHIFRMQAEMDIEENAANYESLIRQWIPSCSFDLVMLGMGEDGHTASLFPRTHGLHTKDRLAIANYVPQKHTWRMSLTYECIHDAKVICIYALGKRKAAMVADVLMGPYDPDNYPVQRVGTSAHKALWILDKEASEKLVQSLGLKSEV
ncbi:6-phosphogluconolactonase [Candidatus Protochlamydia phocaeensis]|uniref:6-phosphogluconolactonase n=1 Tax=Candidatus Protochlamydia phocaeensis TaxID=1414722 RepID=UPI000838E7D4|nr:6-phosphogluconolactonase [Candidatus Protochlamydia phocaeensis]